MAVGIGDGAHMSLTTSAEIVSPFSGQAVRDLVRVNRAHGRSADEVRFVRLDSADQWSGRRWMPFPRSMKLPAEQMATPSTTWPPMASARSSSALGRKQLRSFLAQLLDRIQRCRGESRGRNT